MKGFAIYEFELGKYVIEYEDNTLIGLKRINETQSKINNMNLKNSNRTKFTELIAKEIEQYFSGKRKTFTIKYKYVGTDFQKKVWKALTEIPYGETKSYEEIAIEVGNSKACRAVGMANNKNPISIIVPCHRVIGKNNKLVGYAGGLDIKQKLLDIENKNK